ncbi:MAG: ABC transporter substrate-binding protein [Desulfurococcales archaeon ex4484_217_2]|nr:MAG: ABC transporter substrate-binding protein [Desulfurococcales archaeon ex4484_217_2]
MAHSAQIKLSTVLPVILLIVGIIIGFAVGFAARPPAPTPTATPSPSPTPTVKVVKVTVWASGSPVDVTRVDNIERAANILNRMFEAAGAPVRIEVEKQFFRGDYMEKLTAAFAAGEAPDIIAMKNLPVLADGGYVIALDDYVEKYKDLLEDVYPVLWNAVKYKGKIWALPQDTEARPLYFRKDVLRQLGWSEEEIEALPEKIRNGEVTLLDLIEIAKEAMDKGLVQWGFYHRPNFGGTPFVILYYQYGGILQDPETGKLVLDKSAMLKMLELLYRMAQVDKVLPPTMIGTSWRQIHVDFVNGRVLFWFGGTWHWAEWQSVAYHEELGELPEEYEWENIGFALVPAPEPGLKPMTLSSPYLYYVTAQAEEPEIAFLLITLATSAPIDAIHAVDSGHLPVRSTTVEQPYYKQSKFHREVAYMLEYTSFEPLHPKWGAYKDAWITAITKVEKGEVTPEEALSEMIETLKAELGDELIIRD